MYVIFEQSLIFFKFYFNTMYFGIKKYTLSFICILKVINDLIFDLKNIFKRIKKIKKSLQKYYISLCFLLNMFIIDVRKEKNMQVNEKAKWELASSGVSVKRARPCDCAVDEREVPRGSGHTVLKLRADLFLSVSQ